MLITQGLSISDITYFSKLFESSYSLHIAYTICILLVPHLVELKHFCNIHVSISCSRNNVICSVKLLSLEEHIFQLLSQLLWCPIIEFVHWNVSDME